MPARTLPVSASAPAEPDRRPHRSGVALATLLACQLMFVLDATVMNVALPRIRADLGFSATGLSWVISAYTLVFGGLLLLGGRAGDLFGRRRVFVAGVTLFTAASLAGGLATSAAWLVAARVAQGLGAAAAGPSTLALITTTFTEPRRRTRALALFSGMSSAGFAVGLVVGGVLTEWLGWRSVLFINVPVGTAVALLAARHVRAPEAHRVVRLDLAGALTGTAAVAVLVYGFVRAASNGWGDGGTRALLACGLPLLAAFLAVEARARQPLMPLRLFGDRNRAAAYLNFFLGPMAGMSTFFFLTQYLQEVRGFGALATGFAFLPMPAVLFAVTRLIPRLLARSGPRPSMVAGTALMAVGLLLLVRLTTDSGYVPALLAPMVLVGLGMGLAFAPLNVVIMSTVPREDAGAAGGVLQTMQQCGATLGLAVLVTVFGAAGRHAAGVGRSGQQVLVTGMTHAFAAATAVAVLAFAVALTVRRGR